MSRAQAIRWKSKDGLIELRLGDWREVLADVETCDAVITDPPYSKRTHDGHRTESKDGAVRRELNYDHMTEGGVREMIQWIDARLRGWMFILTSHDLFHAFQQEAERVGRYAFHPIPCVMPGMTVRLCGDGPSSWAVWGMASRPSNAEFSSWGTLPGAYQTPPGERVVVGGKPLVLMRAIVRDYSRKGDLIVDPCAGGGTTLLAAATEGRRSIGAEIDPETFEKAVKRMERGYTPDLFGGE